MVHEFKSCWAVSTEPGACFGFCVSLSLCPSSTHTPCVCLSKIIMVIIIIIITLKYPFKAPEIQAPTTLCLAISRVLTSLYWVQNGAPPSHSHFRKQDRSWEKHLATRDTGWCSLCPERSPTNSPKKSGVLSLWKQRTDIRRQAAASARNPKGHHLLSLLSLPISISKVKVVLHCHLCYKYFPQFVFCLLI